jgi:hypothetical protein
MHGPGYFRWNTGGWFGSQFGGTAWMLVGAVVLARQAPDVAFIWLACFAIANAIGWALWRRRDQLRPYPAIQALIAMCGGIGVIALALKHLLRPGLGITPPMGVDAADDLRSIVCLVAVFIGLMAYFHLMERSTRRQKSRSSEC